MTQTFNFTTNIEHRMPDTGKVYCIDRMTSDWAKAHPFDVDGFIEQVFDKYNQIAQDDPRNFGGIVRSREQLHRLWNLVLQMPIQGDKNLYPNNHGRQEPALMEVWLKAGDFWRCGLRKGDVLPDCLPMTKITRLGDGSEWIALFPKDMGLLEQTADKGETKCHEIVAVERTVTDSVDNTKTANNQRPDEPSEQNDAPEYCESEKSEPMRTAVELDMFAQMQAELEAVRCENEALKAENENLTMQCNMTQTEVCTPLDDFDTENCPCETQGQPSTSHGERCRHQEYDRQSFAERKRRQQEQARRSYEHLYSTPAITVDHDTDDHSDRNRKILAAVATAVVFIVLVNTVGLFGIAAIGLLAGGFIK